MANFRQTQIRGLERTRNENELGDTAFSVKLNKDLVFYVKLFI